MRAHQVRSAAAGNNQLSLAVLTFVPAVMMQISRQNDGDRKPVLFDQIADEVGKISVGIRGIARIVDPTWLRRAQDDPIAFDELCLENLEEVRLLRRVDARVERDVDSPQPPAIRQLRGKVAAALHEPPAAEKAALTEFAHEVGESVIPIVIAGNREQTGRRVPRGGGKRAAEGKSQLPAVAVAGRCRVDEISAEDDDLRRRKRVRAAPDLQFRRREQHGGRIGRVPGIADVRDEVDPGVILLRQVQSVIEAARRPGRDLGQIASVECRECLPSIDEFLADRRKPDVVAGSQQFERVQPGDRLWRLLGGSARNGRDRTLPGQHVTSGEIVEIFGGEEDSHRGPRRDRQADQHQDRVASADRVRSVANKPASPVIGEEAASGARNTRDDDLRETAEDKPQDNRCEHEQHRAEPAIAETLP